MEVLGIDIGGSGIKGAIVDTSKGEFVSERRRLPTPHMAKPDEVADIVQKIVKHFKYSGPIGAGFPGVVIRGEILTAANIDKSWIGVNAAKLFSKRSKNPVVVFNDADSAGIAEITFGAGRDIQGVVLLLTIGTGIGSALFVDGQLVPNTELGHLIIRGKDAEHRASDGTRQRKEMSWEKWAVRLEEALLEYEKLFWPDLFILGGGVSKKSEIYIPLLKTRAKIVPAQMRNQAGIIGAAVYAENMLQSRI